MWVGEIYCCSLLFDLNLRKDISIIIGLVSIKKIIVEVEFRSIEIAITKKQILDETESGNGC